MSAAWVAAVKPNSLTLNSHEAAQRNLQALTKLATCGLKLCDKTAYFIFRCSLLQSVQSAPVQSSYCLISILIATPIMFIYAKKCVSFIPLIGIHAFSSLTFQMHFNFYR